MELIVLEATPERVRAGYDCPCGCHPSVEYARGGGQVDEGCCCGNHFAVGPHASGSLSTKPGFHPESTTFETPWGQRLEAAWMVGPGVHPPAEEHGHGHSHEAHEATQAIDPVCGMSVEPEAARAKGLSASHDGTEYFFCGKGCKLEFGDDPEHYLAPGYVPSM